MHSHTHTHTHTEQFSLCALERERHETQEMRIKVSHRLQRELATKKINKIIKQNYSHS